MASRRTRRDETRVGSVVAQVVRNAYGSFCSCTSTRILYSYGYEYTYTRTIRNFVRTARLPIYLIRSLYNCGRFFLVAGRGGGHALRIDVRPAEGFRSIRRPPPRNRPLPTNLPRLLFFGTYVYVRVRVYTSTRSRITRAPPSALPPIVDRFSVLHVLRVLFYTYRDICTRFDITKLIKFWHRSGTILGIVIETEITAKYA